jgi:agmatinase
MSISGAVGPLSHESRRNVIMRDPFTRTSRKAGLFPVPERARRHHPDFDKLNTQGWKALDAESKLSEGGWRKEQQWALNMGLPGADT